MHFYAKEICLCARHFTEVPERLQTGEDCLLIERMGVGFPRRHTFLRDTETDSEVIAQVLERSSKASYAHRSLARQHKYALLVSHCPAVKRHGIRIQEMCLTVNKILGYSIDCCRFYYYNFQPQLLSPPPWVCSKSFSEYEKKNSTTSPQAGSLQYMQQEHFHVPMPSHKRQKRFRR